MEWGYCLQRGVIGWLGRQREYRWRGRFSHSGSTAYGVALYLDTQTELPNIVEHLKPTLQVPDGSQGAISETLDEFDRWLYSYNQAIDMSCPLGCSNSKDRLKKALLDNKLV